MARTRNNFQVAELEQPFIFGQKEHEDSIQSGTIKEISEDIRKTWKD